MQPAKLDDLCFKRLAKFVPVVFNFYSDISIGRQIFYH